jgi:hypothetical protein
MSSAVVADSTTLTYARAAPLLIISRITALGPTVMPIMTVQALLLVLTRIIISSSVNGFSTQEINMLL